MLVLSREVGSGITLENRHTGEQIKLKMTAISHKQGRIGIDASQDWVIYRDELRPQYVKEAS